jgi:BirA family transcriptional regulator, biotin operon repressor / biotin---[acetyl-CoA-carboxylase] ligase
MSNAQKIGKVYICHDELPSTQDFMVNLLSDRTKSKPVEGTVVRAASQSAGRGQFGSRWESLPHQNLTLSILLEPHWLPVERQFFLSMAVALAIRDTVAAHGLPFVSIKWPNDILIGGRKTAGILIQNSISGQGIQHAIIGIGLNVNQIQFPDFLPNAGSMALAAGHPFELDGVMLTLFGQIEQHYEQLKRGEAAALKSTYESHLFRRDEPALFLQKQDRQPFEGIIRGVTDEGLLRVEMANKLEKRFDLKEIEMIL